MTHASQFALPFPQDPSYAPEAFLSGRANEEALAWLDRPGSWPMRRLAVHGEAGTGKTHFLHLFASRNRAALIHAAALRAFATLPDTPALAIDAADTAPAPALLHALNGAADRGMIVLLAGRSAPALWAVALPDLVSRLRAMPAVPLHPQGDGLLRAMLTALLAERQMVMPERLRDYLLARLPRTGGALRDAVSRLERLALASGGQVTRTMAATIVEATDEPVTLHAASRDLQHTS